MNWSCKTETINLQNKLPQLYDRFELFYKTSVVSKVISQRNRKNAQSRKTAQRGLKCDKSPLAILNEKTPKANMTVYLLFTDED